MVTANREHCHFNDNKFFTEVWLKYATKVQKPEDIYDFMLEHNIGTMFASTYE